KVPALAWQARGSAVRIRHAPPIVVELRFSTRYRGVLRISPLYDPLLEAGGRNDTQKGTQSSGAANEDGCWRHTAASHGCRATLLSASRRSRLSAGVCGGSQHADEPELAPVATSIAGRSRSE